MNSFFSSQFSYCPLIWMCHSRTVNHKINKLHERCLRIIYSDKKPSFKELLENAKPTSPSDKNVQGVQKYISPIVRQLFQSRKNDYKLRPFSQFELPNVKSVFCGTESISFLGPKIGNIVPNEFKKETPLNAFKKLIKKWEPENCPWRLCKSHIQNLDFVSSFVFKIQFCLDVYSFCYCNLFQYFIQFIWLTQISIHYSQFCLASIIIFASTYDLSTI